MAIRHMNDIWDSELNPREKLLALAIADCANDKGIAYPGYSNLQKKTGYARATVAAGIKTLKEIGWCFVENNSEFGKGKKVNVYLIQPKVQWLNYCPKSSAVELPKVQSVNSSAVEPPKVQSTPPKSSAVEHETPVEPPLKENPQLKKGKFNPLKNRPDFIDNDHWVALIENRKFKKLQNTKLALTTFVGSLQKAVDAGFTVEECIGEYVASSWKRFDHTWIKKADNATDDYKPKNIREANAMRKESMCDALLGGGVNDSSQLITS